MSAYVCVSHFYIDCFLKKLAYLALQRSLSGGSWRLRESCLIFRCDADFVFSGHIGF